MMDHCRAYIKSDTPGLQLIQSADRVRVCVVTSQQTRDVKLKVRKYVRGFFLSPNTCMH